jgi:hypothetical protein
MSSTRNSGGVATQTGIDYQNRVAAWTAVRILAEHDAAPSWGLPAPAVLAFLRCETEQPVDDLLVGISGGGHAFVQVKHGLTLTTGDDSPFASAIDQFVRQYIVSRSVSSGPRPGERPLDRHRDRLLLLVDSSSSGSVRTHLAAVLSNVRQIAPGQSIESVAHNASQQEALDTIRAHIGRSWQKASGEEPDAVALLALLRIEVLDLNDGESAEREAKTLLRTSVLRDPTQSDVAWDTLVQACAHFAQIRSGTDRKGLQQILANAHIVVRAPRSYREDIEQLLSVSRSMVDAVSELSRVRVGAKEVKIARQSTAALRQAVEMGSVVVVGEPGAGESGALHDVASALQNDERDVVFFAVDRLEASSLGALRTELGLTHELREVLGNWPGNAPGFLIIDALDAARSDASAQTLRHLLRDILQTPSRWRVVASIRKFDLRYDQELRRLFAGAPLSEFRDGEFAAVRHVNIPRLSDDELAQVSVQSQELGDLIVRSNQGLHDLLRVAFNLRLLAELLSIGVAVENLTPIRTQIELLDRYWQERVICSDSRGDARETILRQVAEKMVASRSLRVSRSIVASSPAADPALMEVLGSHVLVEWQPSPEARPDRYILTFAHHVLFDYAIARLLLRGLAEDFIRLLAREPELVLAIRPSLVLHFQYAWLSDQSRVFFWDLVHKVMRTTAIPAVGKIIGPSVAAELTTQVSDCEPLFRALEDPNPNIYTTAESTLRHLVGAILADTHRPPVGPHASPWCEVLERVS